jgi:hypothetical protein
VSARVPVALKAQLADLADDLTARGLAVSQTELVEFGIEDLIKHGGVDLDALQERIMHWRATGETR